MTIASAIKPSSLSPQQFQDLRDIIYEISGIFFAENKLYLLENRLGRRTRELGLESFDAYIKHIKTQDSGSPEYHQIYNAITINETFFFRFQAQLESFKKLLSDIKKTRQAQGSNSIKIWSAASSSGEELYTIAIILDEFFGPDLKNWDIYLLGTDISHRALQIAGNAMYGNNSFRGSMTPEQKAKYFAPEGNTFKLRDDVKQLVQFRYLNLNDTMEMRKLTSLDFVFCRNVMIYFDEEMKKRVLRSIYGSLGHGGYLFLGEAESLHGISSAFKVEHFSGAFAYKKE
ncbi:MAG: protein-glutamate O-methyltransferase CheR [Candidatus Marinimicrobia bacterium]|nr:protein-glutamate O-methyltransferase CheR [Candidatus Neomarinimicrobiota bacterium]